MSDLYYCGWRPVITRTMLGGVVLYGALAMGYADDKGSKQRGGGSSAASTTQTIERAPRVERQSIKMDVAPRHNNGQSSVQGSAKLPSTVQILKAGTPNGGNSAAKFQPSFSRETERAKLTPARAHISPQNTPSNFGSGAPKLGVPQAIAFLPDGKGNGKDKEKPPRNESKAPRVEQPKPPKVEQPKPPKVELPKPVKVDPPKISKPMNDAPRIVSPKVAAPKIVVPKADNPMPKVKINPEVKANAKIELPKSGKGPATNDDDKKIKIGGSGGRKTPADKPVVDGLPGTGYNPNAKIRIKKPDETDKPANADIGKIKIRTPQPDGKPDTKPNVKIANPALKDAGKDIGKIVNKPARLKDGATLTRDQHEKIKLDLDKAQKDLVGKGKGSPKDLVKVKLPATVKVAGTEKLKLMPREALKVPVPKNGKLDPKLAAKLKMKPAHDVLDLKLKNGDFKNLANVKSGKQFQLHKQFEFHKHGDIGRRMNLLAGLRLRGGWNHRHFGPISPMYTSHCKSMWYAGPSFCSPYLWYPGWSPWVDWCWWDTCAPLYDPRPIICHPVVYDPCSPWVHWHLPAWTPLPYVACGTWVDVEPVVISSGMDLQLLATRFVDPGHPDQELGPRFRVWVRNNSPVDLVQPFNVLLIASTDANAYAGLPEAGVRVLGLRAGETQAIDIRLPYVANIMGRDSEGHAIPFTYLNALVDSHNELPEAFEANNGATLVRGDILPVDPAAFAADPSSAQPTGIIHVAGEGFGPEPGQALVVIGDQEYQAEILGWFDLGVQIRVPNFELDSATAADLVIIRGDGAASNPLTIEIDPAAPTIEISEAPAPELPGPPPLPEPIF